MSLTMAGTDPIGSSASPQPAKESLRSKLTPERKRLYKNFLLATTATYLSVLITKRAVAARKHVPTLFAHNGTTLPFNKYQDGVQAVALGTLLSCSVFAMGVTGTTLILNINNVNEFHDTMRTFMKGTGLQPGLSKKLEDTVDPKVLELEAAIENFMSGAFESKPKDESEKK